MRRMGALLLRYGSCRGAYRWIAAMSPELGVSGLASAPDLLARPLPSPVDGDERIVGFRAFSRPEFDQVVDVESVGTQEPDPVAVREVELDLRIVGPLDTMHAELRAQ